MVWKLTEREVIQGVKKVTRIVDLDGDSATVTLRPSLAWRGLHGAIPRRSWKYRTRGERQYAS